MHGLLPDVLYENFITEFDALVADVHTGTRYDFVDLVGALSAERAADLSF
jgi:hypothetical protein